MSTQHPLGFFVELLKNMRLSWRLLWDRRMPLWTKSVPLGAALYLVWPIDLLADPLLGLGQLDDLAIILLAARLFISLAPVALLADLGAAEQIEPPTAQVFDARPRRTLDVEGKTRLLTAPESEDK